MSTEDDVPILRSRADDSDDVLVRYHRVIPDVTGDERIYARIVEALSVMTASGARAEDHYRKLLRSARRDDEFAGILAKTAASTEEDAYEERWALTQLLVDLENPVAADYLADLVRRPVPEEKAEDPSHGLSTVTEEVILRTTAMEGLARLQRRGTETAEVLLEAIASAEYVALRRAAWFALIDGKAEDAAKRARELLAERDEEWIADLKRIPVEEAPQAEAESKGRRPREDAPAPFDE